MKKVLSFTAIAALVAMVACGPSAEETAAAAQKVRDSIVADSIKQADEKAAWVKDSTDKAAEATAAAAQKMADSLHQDSIDKKLIKVKK